MKVNGQTLQGAHLVLKIRSEWLLGLPEPHEAPYSKRNRRVIPQFWSPTKELYYNFVLQQKSYTTILVSRRKIIMRVNGQALQGAHLVLKIKSEWLLGLPEPHEAPYSKRNRRDINTFIMGVNGQILQGACHDLHTLIQHSFGPKNKI